MDRTNFWNLGDLIPEGMAYQGLKEVSITSLIFDSREVQKDSLFFALLGVHTDGHEYIEKAIELGASCIVHSRPLTTYHSGIGYVQVENTRAVMAPVSERYYDFPARELQLIGVTGTDGKSSTVSFIHGLLEEVGISAGFFSTVNLQTGNSLEKNRMRQSTPEAPFIQKALREMVDNKKRVAVVEATSHGLSREMSRLVNLSFDVAVLTNISHEHLEFHRTFDRYLEAKRELFKQLKPNGLAILNQKSKEVESFEKIVRQEKNRVEFYGLLSSDESRDREGGIPSADLFVQEYKQESRGLEFRLEPQGISASAPLFGAYNLENLCAALLAVREISGREVGELAPFLKNLSPPEGRMALVQAGQPYTVLVDYAHTPGSFERVLSLMKETLQPKRLLVLFGSAGERDREKRPLQGEIADRYSDIIFLSEEDPRGEKSEKILEDIAEGITKKERGVSLFLIADRREGLKKMISLARSGDLVLALGKGHEGNIIRQDGEIEWNEKEILTEIIRESLS